MEGAEKEKEREKNALANFGWIYVYTAHVSLPLCLFCLYYIASNVAYEQWLQKAPVERGQPVGVIRRKFMNFTTAAASLRQFEVCAASQPVI